MEVKFRTVKAKVETVLDPSTAASSRRDEFNRASAVIERNKRAARYSEKCARRRQARAQVRTARLLGISAAVFFFVLALKLGTMI